MLDYITRVRELIDKIEETQQANIEKAAELFEYRAFPYAG